MKRLRKPYVSRRTFKRRFTLRGGPFNGEQVWLTDANTLPFRVRGVVGRYVNSRWEQLS